MNRENTILLTRYHRKIRKCKKCQKEIERALKDRDRKQEGNWDIVLGRMNQDQPLVAAKAAEQVVDAE